MASIRFTHILSVSRSRQCSHLACLTSATFNISQSEASIHVMWPVMTNQGPVFMSYDQSEGTWVSTRPAASSRAPSSSSAPPSPPGSGCRSPSGTTAHARDCSALTTQIWETLSYTETSECGMGGFLPVREPEELGWQKLLLSAMIPLTPYS